MDVFISMDLIYLVYFARFVGKSLDVIEIVYIIIIFCGYESRKK